MFEIIFSKGDPVKLPTGEVGTVELVCYEGKNGPQTGVVIPGICPFSGKSHSRRVTVLTKSLKLSTDLSLFEQARKKHPVPNTLVDAPVSQYIEGDKVVGMIDLDKADGFYAYIEIPDGNITFLSKDAKADPVTVQFSEDDLNRLIPFLSAHGINFENRVKHGILIGK